MTVIGRRVRHDAIRTHETGSLDPEDIRSLHGIPLTSPARTLLDSAPLLPTRELAAAVEQAQVKRLVTKQDLRATLERAPSRAGAPVLRALLVETAFIRSEAERRLVALLRAAKLPSPAFNHATKASRSTPCGGSSASCSSSTATNSTPPKRRSSATGAVTRC